MDEEALLLTASRTRKNVSILTSALEPEPEQEVPPAAPGAAAPTSLEQTPPVRSLLVYLRTYRPV